MILAISCTSDSFIEIFSVVATIFNVLYIGIAVGLIVYAMIDFAKVVMSDKADNGAAFKIFIKKLISFVFVLIIIPVVLFVLDVFVPDSATNATYTSCTEVIVKGLRNPSSLVRNTAPTEEQTEATRRLQQFQETCSRMNGEYSTAPADTYSYQDANVIDSFSDGTNVHLCKLITQ